MPKLPNIKGQELINFLKSLGFVCKRINGSHHRFENEDGRKTTVPVHGNKDLPKGLLRKIIREDLEMSLDSFIEQFKE